MASFHLLETGPTRRTATSLCGGERVRYPQPSVAVTVTGETSPSLVYGAALLMRLGF